MRQKESSEQRSSRIGKIILRNIFWGAFNSYPDNEGIKYGLGYALLITLKFYEKSMPWEALSRDEVTLMLIKMRNAKLYREKKKNTKKPLKVSKPKK